MVRINSLVFDRSAHLIRHAVDAGERLHFICLTIRRTAILAAAPDLSCVAALEANDLSKVSKGVGSDPADHDGQTGIELIGGEMVAAVPHGPLLHSQNHVLEGTTARIEPAANGDSDEGHAAWVTRIWARFTALRSAPSARPNPGPST